MAKTNSIKKLVNGEIADATDVNQIVESAGAEGGLIPYNEDSHSRDTSGSESLGSVVYPWGHFCVNKDSKLIEVDTAGPSISAEVLFTNLRRFIYLKDAPNSYSGQAGKALVVNSGEDAIEFSTFNSVLFSFALGGDYTVDSHGVIFNDALAPAAGTAETIISKLMWSAYGATYRSVIKSKFKKTAGVNTVTFYARVWQNSGSGRTATVQVSIGGQVGAVTGTPDQTTPEVVTATVDVTSLTNGVVYDLDINLKTSNSNSTAFLDSIIGFGS